MCDSFVFFFPALIDILVVFYATLTRVELFMEGFQVVKWIIANGVLLYISLHPDLVLVIGTWC